MTDCTHNRAHLPHLRSLAAVAIWAAVLGLVLIALPAPARADGDPASDVLATQTLFLPQDAAIPIAQQQQLAELVQLAARRGYPLRVALIASRSDLGSVTELWRQPQTYARFLGQELSLVYRSPLLVVMPNGFGLYNAGGSSGALGEVSVGAGGAAFASAALTAIQRLAAAAGHPVTVPPPAATQGRSSGSDTIAIVAFAVGAALTALAWTASLLARPPRLTGR
ncbi:MAG: hypothetical protein JO304_12510 [Solirubrobacterales bacterium]|nr:hypothetical protein [Solirubrobacterales bacterium]